MIQNFSYGKSGGQGISPLIVVTAPTGSTVTCDGVQGTEVSGTWTFPVIIGTHTIVATQGSNTKTQTVVVDQVAVFSVALDYRTYLYNEGDECTELTGGWTNFVISAGNSPITKTSSHIYLSAPGTSSTTRYCRARSVNAVDLTNYTKYCVKFEDINTIGTYTSATQRNIQTRTLTNDTEDTPVYVDYLSAVSGATNTLEYNISSVTGSKPIVFGIYTSDTSTGNRYINAKVYKVWLE